MNSSRPGGMIRTEAAMGTLVTIHLVRPGAGAEAAIDRAFGWFHEIEERCTRFHPRSELMQLSTRTGEAMAVSAILFEAIQFAWMVAEATGGAFDPTLGQLMAARGFNRHHRSGVGAGSRSPQNPPGNDSPTYRDVKVDPNRRTVTLHRPLTLDLGAVAKGLAVDLAARELASCHDFAIDAGGDLYLAGLNEQNAPWRVGIRDPRNPNSLIASLEVSNQAVCTSGDYERRVPGALVDGEHHILDPRAGASPRAVASATVLAPQAMLADALATAVFVLGPEEGLRLLDQLGVDGLIVTPGLERHQTRGLPNAA